MTVLSVFLGALVSLEGVAIAWLITFPLVRIYLLTISMKEINLRYGKYFGTIRSPVIATALMLVAVILSLNIIPNAAPPILRLAANVTVGAITYVSAVLLLDRPFGEEMKSAVRELFSTAKA